MIYLQKSAKYPCKKYNMFGGNEAFCFNDNYSIWIQKVPKTPCI